MSRRKIPSQARIAPTPAQPIEPPKPIAKPDEVAANLTDAIDALKTAHRQLVVSQANLTRLGRHDTPGMVLALEAIGRRVWSHATQLEGIAAATQHAQQPADWKKAAAAIDPHRLIV